MPPGHVGKESKEVKESYHSYPKHPAVSINVSSNGFAYMRVERY